MKYTVSLDVSFKTTTEEVAKRLGISPEAVTVAHVEEVARDWQENMAGSNDGSELIANAKITVVQTV